MLGDEIVVGTRANGDKSPARRVVSERGDVDMADIEDDEPVAHYPKRKRASLYNDLSEDKMDSSVKGSDNMNSGLVIGKGRPRQKTEESSKHAPQKHVPVGVWRDSSVPDDEHKHSVVGFIDVRDRLRTRLISADRYGSPVNTRIFPLPPGPGGAWVTFERIVFLDHLVGHDHNVIKEYVKIRGETLAVQTDEANVAAIREAVRHLEANPPPETPQLPAIAWGKEIPENAYSGRPETKRRRYGSGIGTIADHSERAERTEQVDQTERAVPVERASIVPQPMDMPLPPRKPTRILVGVWGKSSELDHKNKHAVYGILGANDMFRVKLVRETMDGKFINGNFPSGAGALWIQYDDVLFLDHLKDLTRPEIKEYVRIRQSQIDAGETSDEQRISNETKAVYEAQTRAAAVALSVASPGRAPVQGNPGPGSSSGLGREAAYENQDMRHHLRRDAPSLSEPRSEPLPPPRHSLPEVEIQQATRQMSSDPLERVQGFANREVARMEAVQMRTDRHQANRTAMISQAVNIPMPDNHRNFQDNMHRMQQVWQAQENMRMGPENGAADDVMMHMGIRYERKQNGPFKNRLVSQGTIINIDGEDYVEYRVLTKPSFF